MSTLREKTYRLLRRVPSGRVTTYKALADAVGVKAYRAIGQILKRNPDAPAIPCHRVVATNGAIGGFMGKSSGTAIKKKIALLKREGVVVKNNRVVHFTKVFYPLS